MDPPGLDTFEGAVVEFTAAKSRDHSLQLPQPPSLPVQQASSISPNVEAAMLTISAFGAGAVDIVCYAFLRRFLTARGQEALAAVLEDVAQYAEIRAPASRT
jgi:hypothetical protein